jgi:hypothetical protein
MGKLKSKKGRSSLATALIPGSAKPSNPAQVKVGMWLQGPGALIATQPSTGLLYTAYIAPALSGLTNAASFKAVYDEWRCTKLKFHIVPTNLANGVTKFVVDDEDTTSPTANWMNSRRGTLLSNNSSGYVRPVTIDYRSENFTDLEWLSTNSSPSVANMSLKMYTDSANYGSPTSTNLFYITWEGYFEFRGIGANA